MGRLFGDFCNLTKVEGSLFNFIFIITWVSQIDIDFSAFCLIASWAQTGF